MIEYCNENIWYKKRRKKRTFKSYLSFVIISAIFTSLFFYYKNVITTNIVNICYNYSYSYVTESVNKSISLSLNNSVNYNDLIYVEKDSVGEIVLLSANSYKINKLSKEIALSSEQILKEKISEGIPIPILAFSGINLISGMGREITYKSISISSVECKFDSDFESVGINQTLHSIYINVVSKVNINFPLNSQDILIKTPVLVCEAVLVGKIPNVYLNGNIFE